MASIYDNINTATDLVKEVMCHGLSTKAEDICRAQDIFGNSSVEELVSLANDIGRNDEHGNPDPKGSWGSGRKGTQNTFYSIAFSIWNWEDATRFWNQYTNPDKETLAKTFEDNISLKRQVELLSEQEDRLSRDAIESESKWKSTYEQFREQEARALKAEAEIVQLKAKLYDLMVK